MGAQGWRAGVLPEGDVGGKRRLPSTVSFSEGATVPGVVYVVVFSLMVLLVVDVLLVLLFCCSFAVVSNRHRRRS